MEDWRELLPTAYLLTGSDAAARDLLVRGLARGGGLDSLVRAHLRRRFTRDAALVETPAHPWWVSPTDAEAADALAAALDALTRPERTAVVLRWHDDLPVGRVAELVPGVDLASLPVRLGVPEPDLPRRLDGLASLVDVADLTDHDVALGVRAVRTRRRSRALIAVGVVVTAVAAAVWLPDRFPSPVASSPPSSSPDPATEATPSPPQLGEPRGSLVDDEDLLAAVRDRVDPADDRVQLVFAGDAAGARWVLLVTGTAGTRDDVTAHWFTGPAGADAGDLEQLASAYSAGYFPAAWSATALLADGSQALLVVTRDGDEVQLSPGFDVDTDGSVSRSFGPVEVDDGVAALALDRPGSAGLVYRLVRDDVVVATEGPVQTQGATVSSPSGAARSGTTPVDPGAYAQAVGQALDPTGLGEGDVTVDVLGAGSYPAPGGGTAQAVTVAVTLPDGAVVTATAWQATDGYDVSSAACGTETHPAGTDPAGLTVVTRCSTYAGDSSTFGATVVVAAPSGEIVLLNSAAGGAGSTPELTNGWGFVIAGADDLSQFAAGSTTGEISRAGSGPFDHF